jgi:hypothetical protein
VIIEVQLDGRGAVRVEADYTGTPKQIRGLIDHAAATLTKSTEPQPGRPIGFGAGSALDAEVAP